MSERAIKTYEHYKDLAQRSEYLLVGIIAASIGLFWQTHEPARIGANPSTLHMVGLIMLFWAMFLAIYRIHRQPYIYALMSEEIDLDNERSALVMNASQGNSIASGRSGVMSPTDQVQRIGEIDIKRKLIKEKMDEINDHCSRLYKFRNIVLVLGYAVFLGQRIWLPYT